MVIEVAGYPETWLRAIAMARKGGRVNLFADLPGGTKVSTNTNRMHNDSLRLIATFHPTPSIPRRAFDMITSRRINVELILTNRTKLYNPEEALQLIKEGTALSRIDSMNNVMQERGLENLRYIANLRTNE